MTNREVFMTLIKSTDGSGWVEARVSDSVKYNIEFCGNNTPSTVFEVAGIEGPFLLDCAGNYYHRTSCQLIERPFQVSDEVQFFVHQVLAQSRWWKGVIVRFNNNMPSIKDHYIVFNKETGAYEDVLPDAIRHSSPLLRPVGGV